MTSARQVARVLGATLLAAALLTAPVLACAPAAAATSATVATSRPAGTGAALPLQVSLATLSPAVIPRRGFVRLTGRLDNTSASTWEDVNVMPFLSSSPITSRDGLAQAAATDPNAVVGSRLTDPGTYERVGDLAPGAHSSFRLRLPVSSLRISGAPGVYWIGVHAFGANPDGRGLIGMARTFVPLVPQDVGGRSVPISLVLPLRDPVDRSPDGRLADTERWARLTGSDGRLSRLAGLAASAGDAPLTWVVDPGVLDAIEDFANGNPPLGLEAPARASAQTTPSQGERASARALLQSLLGEMSSADLTVLGYADPDAVSVARRRPLMLARTQALTKRRMAAHRLVGTDVVAPPDGLMDPHVLDNLGSTAIVLLSDQGDLDRPVASRLASGQDLVLADARAGAGGPGPTPSHDLLAVRQRVLAEAALDLEASPGDPRPIVLSLPPRWNPGASWRQARLFPTLQRLPWVRLSSLPRDPSRQFSGTLPYSSTQRSAELPGRNTTATRRLERTGAVVGHLIGDGSTIPDRLSGVAFEAVSWFARRNPAVAADRVDEVDDAVHARLDDVGISGTEFVLLSGGSGTLTLSVANGLDKPVTVAVRAEADPSVRLRIPTPIVIGPGQRSTMRLPVTSRAGVHEVTLQPVTVQGEPAGRAFTFNLRTSEVSKLIWYILVGGIALLAVMIVRRVVLRLRHHRWRSEARAVSSYEEVAR